jgi:hypothetical protein
MFYVNAEDRYAAEDEARAIAAAEVAADMDREADWAEAEAAEAIEDANFAFEAAELEDDWADEDLPF